MTTVDSTEPSGTHYGAAMLRLSLATMWIAHAMLKWLVFTLPGTARYFEGLGIPGVLAYVVFTVEVLGGLALLANLYARQVALALLPILAVATSVHAPNGWVFTANGGGWEYPVFLMVVSIAYALIGTEPLVVRRQGRLAFGR